MFVSQIISHIQLQMSRWWWWYLILTCLMGIFEIRQIQQSVQSPKNLFCLLCPLWQIPFPSTVSCIIIVVSEESLVPVIFFSVSLLGIYLFCFFFSSGVCTLVTTSVQWLCPANPAWLWDFLGSKLEKGLRVVSNVTKYFSQVFRRVCACGLG